MKATKKPITIEYFPLESAYVKEIQEWETDKHPIKIEYYSGEILFAKIFTLEGSMTAKPGDIIIKGVEGEIYPCKKEIFNKTYNINEGN